MAIQITNPPGSGGGGGNLTVSSVASANLTFATIGADANYAQTGVSVTCAAGRWRITHTYHVSSGTGTAVFLYSQTGLYSTDGGNGGGAPVALGGTNYGQQFISSINTTFGLPNSSSSLRTAITLVNVVDFSSSTTVFAVPRIGYSTAGTASVIVAIVAEQIS